MLTSQERNKRYREKHPERRYKTQLDRVNRGKQVVAENTTPCLFCGSTDRIEFHHYDAREREKTITSIFHCALDTIRIELSKCWCLCFHCHKRLHKGLICPFPELYEDKMPKDR